MKKLIYLSCLLSIFSRFVVAQPPANLKDALKNKFYIGTAISPQQYWGMEK